MTQKTRNDISNEIATNINDNSNEDITPAEVREVLYDLNDSALSRVSDTTSNLAEGVNQYFTTARARAAFSAGSGIDITSGVISAIGGGGAVDSVNSQTGVVVLDTDDISDTATNRYTNDTDITRLANTSETNTGDVTVTNSSEIDFTLTGQNITASLIAGSIDETKLDASVNASLDLADSAVQPAAIAGFVDTTGTPANNQIAIFTDSNTIEGDVDLTFDTATNTLTIAPVGLNGIVKTHIVQSDASDGLTLEASNGTDVGILGAGNTANVTWYGAHNFSAATQDTLAGFTGTGKTLGSLATATYPSLTEVSYVKGVTSAIQTQLNGKQASGSYITASSADNLTNKTGNISQWTNDSGYATTSGVAAAYQPLATVLTNTTASFTTAQETKLSGIESGAEVNNISDTNATDLTDGGDTTLHTHDGRYYTESEVDTLLSGKQSTITFGTGVQTALGVNIGSAGAPILFNGAGGTPSSMVGTNITGTASGLTAGNVTTNANLTGEVTSVGNAATLTNSAVIGKVLTGYVSGAGTVAATDTILQAIQKLNANDATNANLTGVVTSVGNATAIADAALSIAKTSGLQTALDGKQPLATVLTNTTASFTTAQETKLAGIEALADVTDATNVAAAGAVMTSEKGAANGVAPLGSDSKISTSYLPAAVLGAANYQGVWNASTNTPTLTSSSGTKGFYYVVDVAGSTNLNGITDWKLGDWAIYNGSAWEKVDNTDAVISVNSQIGAVVLDADDISDSGTTNKWTNASDISKLAGIEAGADVTDTTNVTAAGALMDSEVTSLSGIKTLTVPDNTTVTTLGAAIVSRTTPLDVRNDIAAQENLNSISLSTVTAAADDKIFINDTDNFNVLRFITPQTILDILTFNDTDDFDFTRSTNAISAVLKATAISAKSAATLAGTEEVLVNDAGTLKKTTTQAIANLAGGVPSGSVMDYAGATLPTDWLWCDGSVISRATYANLFTAIGTTYGAGDGSTTFALPDLRGRVSAGKDNMDNTVGTGGGDAGRLTSGSKAAVDGDTLGASGGVQQHTLLHEESGVPAHSHPYLRHNTVSRTSSGANTAGAGSVGATTSDNAAADAAQAHTNVQPTLVLNKIIKI